MQDDVKILVDVQKETARSNKTKDRIIILLIVLMFLEAVVFFRGFIWYESQYDYVTTKTTDQNVDLSSEGDNASAEYNDVNGDQYNDSAVHNEGGGDE